MTTVILPEPLRFDWDQGNQNKNRLKHGIEAKEIESVFRDEDRVIFEDVAHSIQEKRYVLLGKSNHCRLLYTVFTLRVCKIRVISTRLINKRERALYEKTT